MALEALLVTEIPISQRPLRHRPQKKSLTLLDPQHLNQNITIKDLFPHQNLSDLIFQE